MMAAQSNGIRTLEIREGGGGLTKGLIYRATARNRHSVFLRNLAPAGDVILRTAGGFGFEIESSRGEEQPYFLGAGGLTPPVYALPATQHTINIRAALDALVDGKGMTAEKVTVKTNDGNGRSFEAQGHITKYQVGTSYNRLDVVEFEIQVDGEIREVRE